MKRRFFVYSTALLSALVTSWWPALAATITVNSANDPAGFNAAITIGGLGSTVTLRDAVNAARNSYNVDGGVHTITFDPALAGQTIYLSQIGEASGPSALVPGENGFFRNITIQGLTNSPGITIARAADAPEMRLFFVTGDQTDFTINDVTLANGVAPSNNWGGAMLIVGTDVVLNRCTIKDNTALFGGGLYVRESIVTVNNCTFSGNNALEQGGGIYVWLSQLTLNHVTMAGNAAVLGGGGGLFCYTGTYPTLKNTLIAGNTGGDISGLVFGGGSYNNLIGSSFPTSGGLTDGVNGNLVDRNPFLGSLADNGGPTPTFGFAGPSPAFDAGLAIGGITTDQRGIARPQGSAPDIGAYEAAPEAPVITSATNTTFISFRANEFRVLASGYPAPTYSVSGSLPSGVALSTNGYLSGIPALGTEGDYPIVITASNGIAPNGVQNFTLTVARGNLVVTTAVDENDGSPDPLLGAGLSLREAVNYANTQSDPQIITFDSSLAGQTISLTNVGHTVYGNSALLIQKDITIQGLTGTGGITIARGGPTSMRLFYVSFAPAKLTLNDLTLANGIGGYGGAVINVGTLVANRCTFLNNSATLEGGAINNVTAGGAPNATLVNCTIVSNTATFNGGAIWTADNSPLTLINVTLTGNNAGNTNGGIHGAVRLTNSIVAGNTRSGTIASDLNGPATGQYNIIGTGGAGGLTEGVDGNMVGVTNLGLRGLGYYGGPTPTRALLRTSVARDAGTAAAGVTNDQRRFTRPIGAASDIGAVEYQPSYVVTTTADEDDGASEASIGAGTSLREALQDATGSGAPQTITFSPLLAGQTVLLTNGWNDAADASALRVSTEVTVQGLGTSPGITLMVTNSTGKRHFLVENTGSLTVDSLTLTGGYGDNGGAVWNFGSLTVRNSTLHGNHATSEGGAIQSWGDSPSLVIENSTIAANSSDGLGTAMNIGSAVMALQHVTITSNTGASVAVSIYKNQVGATNTLIAGNSVDGVGSVIGGIFAPGSSNNLLAPGGSAGLTNGVNGNLVGTPAGRLYLGGLADNGGPTPTVALLPGSPAINGGGMTGLSTDQRGFSRTVGGAPDIGAVENETGDADPDRDVISNAEEAGLGTNPLSIDSDNDGFNDATEVMAGSDPLLTNSIPGATRIERVLGFGPARGLDLSGNFVYAFNVGTPGAAGTAGDATFTADTAPGITVSAPQQIAAWINPAFGISPGDAVLSAVYQSIRWADYTNTVRVTLANLVPGQRYKLQLMFGEQGFAARVFDVLVDGVLVADDFRPYAAQGGKQAVYAASAVVCEFTASGDTVNIVLDGENVPLDGGPDRNPILNGVTLELTAAISDDPAVLNGFVRLPGGAFSGSFTNAANSVFSLYTTTNLFLPMNAWSNMGPVVESPAGSGMYQFTVPENPSDPQRFYRITSP